MCQYGLAGRLPILQVMDIARPEFKQRKRRRQIALIAGIVVVVAILTAAVYKLKPAAPSVERGTVWTDTVKRGSILRQVLGLGTLIPMEIRWIPAETEARVEHIVVLAGTPVKADTIIIEISNPQAEQEMVDSEWQLRAAEAELKNARVKVESDLMTQKAGAATVSADYNNAKRQAELDSELAKLGVISGQSLKTSEGREQEMA